MNSLLRDHTAYSKNSVQVTSRLAALLQDPAATLLTEHPGIPASDEARQVNRNEKYVRYVAWLALFRIAALPASVIAGLNVVGVDAFPRLTKYIDDTIAKKDGLLGSIWRASTTPEVVNTIVVSGVCLLTYLALGFVGTRVWRLGEAAMSAGAVWSPLRTAPFLVLCTATIVFSTTVVAAAAGVRVLSFGMYVLVTVALLIVLTPTVGLTAPSELPARRPTSPDA